MSLGGTIYRLRTEKNMSQGDLADALDVSRQSVSKWENDSSIPDLDKLKKLSQLFGVSLDELVNGEPRPEPETQPQTIIYAAPERQPMPGNQLAGIILLICAAVVFVTFTLVGYFAEEVLLGLLLSFPLVLNGTVCMLCRKNTGFFCCWTNYVLVWFLSFMVTIRTFNDGNDLTPGQIFAIVMLVLLAAMVAWSLCKLYKGHFSAGRTAKAVWTVILILLLVFQSFLSIKGTSNTGGTMIYGEEERSYIDDVTVLPDDMG